MKIIQTDNIAAHYRAPIYHLMAKELGCEFCFGDSIGDDIKKMDYASVPTKVIEVHNVRLGHGLTWQKGITKLLSMDYDRIIYVGETRCLSTWWSLIRGRFCRNKKTYVWTHGWYGKETEFEKVMKKIFFRLPTGGVFLYGNYARELMINEGFKPERLFVIHNSLDHDSQIEIRKLLSSKPIYTNHFQNNDSNLFFVGRLTKQKRLDMALKAMALLKDRGENYNMTFIGGGDMQNDLELLANELGIKNNVWFYGPCYDEKVLGEMIYNADLCVAPGNIGLTSMHTLVFGTPAITHNDFPYQMPEFEAIREGETGTFFIRDSVESLAENIGKWFTEKSGKREEVRKACMEEIDNYWTPQYQIEVLREGLK